MTALAQQVKSTPMAPYIGLMRGMSRRDIQIVMTFLNEVLDEVEETKVTVSSDSLVEMARKRFNVPESPETKWFREHGPEAAFLLDLGKQGLVCNCVAPVTFTTMSYLLHNRSRQEIYDCLQKSSCGIEVLSMDAVQFQQAMSFGPVRNFEDMMQYQCALSGGCEVIITNDRKGFEEHSTLLIMTATEFLQSMMEE